MQSAASREKRNAGRKVKVSCKIETEYANVAKSSDRVPLHELQSIYFGGFPISNVSVRHINVR